MAVFSGSIGCDHMDVPEHGFSFTCWLQSIHATPTCCCACRLSLPQPLAWFLRKFRCALSDSLSPRSVQCGVITKCCCGTKEKTCEFVASWIPQGHHLWFTECLSHRLLEDGSVCWKALLYFCPVLSLFHHHQTQDPGWTFDLAWPGSHVDLLDRLHAE